MKAIANFKTTNDSFRAGDDVPAEIVEEFNLVEKGLVGTAGGVVGALPVNLTETDTEKETDNETQSAKSKKR